MNGSPTTYTLDPSASLRAGLAAGLTQVLTDGTNSYLYGVGRIGEEQPGGRQYHLGDALGTVRQLANSAAAVTLTRSYEPFGDAAASVGHASTVMQFTAEMRDATGLTYLRARYYVSYLNQWIQPDPIVSDSYTPADWNRYAYVRNNPINYTDPSGMCLDEDLDGRCDWEQQCDDGCPWPESVENPKPIPGDYAVSLRRGLDFYFFLRRAPGWWHAYPEPSGGPCDTLDWQVLLTLPFQREGWLVLNTDTDWRDAFKQAFGRKFWDLTGKYGSPGSFAFLGSMETVKKKSALHPGSTLRLAYDLVGEILEGDYRDGYLWNAPYDWGSQTPNVPSELLHVLRDHPDKKPTDDKVGKEREQIWYITDDGMSFVLTPKQQDYWCGGASCVR